METKEKQLEISDETELVIIDPNAESFEIRRRNITVIPTIASEGMCFLNSKYIINN